MSVCRFKATSWYSLKSSKLMIENDVASLGSGSEMEERLQRLA